MTQRLKGTLAIVAVIVAVVVIAAVGVIVSRDHDSQATPASGPQRACAAVFTGDVVDALGIGDGADPTWTSPVCRLSAQQGDVTIRRDVSLRSLDADEADARFKDRCADLFSPGQTTEQQPTWVGADIASCASLPADGQPGTPTLLVLTTSQTMLSIQVQLDDPPARGPLQQALGQIAANADQKF